MMKKWVKQWLGPADGAAGPVEDSFPWIPLEDADQLEDFEKKGAPSVRVVFKHSTRCGLSAMMLRRFEATWAGRAPDMDFYLLDLVRYRQLSDALAHRFELGHQSPQVLIIRQGTLVGSASHGDIAGLKAGDYQE